MVVEKEATSSTNIPLDIIETILLLQPSKSLLRFKTVCKSWNDIISDYEFGKNHLQQSKVNSRNQNLFLWKRSGTRYDQEYRLVKFENDKFQTIQENPYPGTVLLCSADGLALLSIRCSTSSYLLWNPSTKQHTTISCPYYDIFDKYWTTTFGFCRGPDLDDYKIVVATCSKNYAVYSCKNKAWTKKKEFTCRIIIDSAKGGLFVNGLSFWIMRETNVAEIFYFDPRNETFNKLQWPIKAEGSMDDHFNLISLKGCLCLYEDMIGTSTRIWILRDSNVDNSSNSWSELMTISNYNIVHGLEPWSWIAPLFFTEKNELVILSRYEHNKLGIYNSMEKKIHEIDSPTYFKLYRFSVTSQCLDTLFFPGQ